MSVFKHIIKQETLDKATEMFQDVAPHFMNVQQAALGEDETTFFVSGVAEVVPTYQLLVYDLSNKLKTKYGANIDVIMSDIKDANGTVTNLYIKWKAAKKLQPKA